MIWLTWLLRTLIVVGICVAGLAIWAQPKMADDWNLAWTLAHYGSPGNFLVQSYLGWSGRMLPLSIAGLAVSSDTATQVFKLLTVPCFLLFSTCAFYLGTGITPRLDEGEGRHWLLAAAVLWLGLPVVSDTIVQTTGAFGYLWPATAGLALLCLLRQSRDRARAGRIGSGGWGKRAAWLTAGIVTGICHEQVFAGIAVVLVGWGWMLWREGRLRYLPAEAWYGVAGLILGTLILVAAPGNYVRLGTEGWTAGGIGSMLLRYGMYLGGAYFGLGTGDTGRALWLGIAVVALSGAFALKADRIKDAVIWVAASLATLAPMLPLVNIASPRTTFFAVTLLIIAALTAFPMKTDAGKWTPATWLAAYALATLVVIDGLVGWAANRSLATEVAAREKILQTAAAEGRQEAVVPYLATVPSRLTYMLNPQHDAEFLPKLARHYGLANASFDNSTDAPRPYTLNSLKALKKSL